MNLLGLDTASLWQAVLNALALFWADTRSITILALIALNLVTGIMAALRTHTFAWRQVADFFGSRVIPYVLGYLTVYIFGAVLGVATPAAVREILQAIDQWAGAGAAMVSLLAAIAVNLQTFQTPPPPHA